MHVELRELLRDASGDSEFVLAVNIDIRGFSSFFSDSSQAAAFLGSAYTRILDEYFPDVSFFKPTGDGLLIVRQIDRENLQTAVRTYVEAALKLDEDFANICDGDDLINFDTPNRVGIGLARGTATRIANGMKVLDFSGFPLNLASRLMDLARPGGVVFDESLGSHLLEESTLDRFAKTPAYIKGLAELAPMTVFHTEGVVIPDANKGPIGAEYFSEKQRTVTFKKFRELGPRFMYQLSQQPSSTDSVRLHLTFPKAAANGQKSDVLTAVTIEPTEVEQRPQGLHATFNLQQWVPVFEKTGLKNSWKIDAVLSYSVPIGTGAAQDNDDSTPQPNKDDSTSGPNESGAPPAGLT